MASLWVMKRDIGATKIKNERKYIRMKKVKLIAVLTAVVLGLIVILQNAQPVETRFLVLTVTMPNAILLGLTLLVGVAIGILTALILSGKRDVTKK